MAWGSEPGCCRQTKDRRLTGPGCAPGSLWSWDCCEVFSILTLGEVGFPHRALHPRVQQQARSMVQVSVPKATTPAISTALGTLWSFVL